MPQPCYDLQCPQYEFPTEQEAEQEDTEAAALRAEWRAYLEDIDMRVPPKSDVEKCKEYCKEVEKAEAEKCRRIREKLTYALKIAGCPSRVLPYEKKKKSTKATTSKTATKKR